MPLRILSKKLQKHTTTHRNHSEFGLFRQGFSILFFKIVQKAVKTNKSIQQQPKSVQKDSKSIQIRRGRLSNSLQKVWVPLQSSRSWWWSVLAENASFHIRILSEDASFRLAFPKARFSDSLFSRRVFHIRLSDSAPRRFGFLKARLSDSNSFTIA